MRILIKAAVSTCHRGGDSPKGRFGNLARLLGCGKLMNRSEASDPAVNSFSRAEIVELIRRIQSGEGGGPELDALERVTGNPNVWAFFGALELEGMAPDKMFDLFCGPVRVRA